MAVFFTEAQKAKVQEKIEQLEAQKKGLEAAKEQLELEHSQSFERIVCKMVDDIMSSEEKAMDEKIAKVAFQISLLERALKDDIDFDTDKARDKLDIAEDELASAVKKRMSAYYNLREAEWIINLTKE